MRVLAAVACLALLPSAAFAGALELSQTPFRVAAAASSCSGWKVICEARGPGCDKKFRACLKSGCWTEGAQHGGARHCGLAKN